MKNFRCFCFHIVSVMSDDYLICSIHPNLEAQIRKFELWILVQFHQKCMNEFLSLGYNRKRKLISPIYKVCFELCFVPIYWIYFSFSTQFIKLKFWVIVTTVQALNSSFLQLAIKGYRSRSFDLTYIFHIHFPILLVNHGFEESF